MKAIFLTISHLKSSLMICFLGLILMISSCVSQKTSSPEGVFYGMFPCADCSGINYELTLEGGNMYTEKIWYIGKSSEVIQHSGRYEVLQERVITLVDKPVENGMRQFAMEGEKLRMLDLAGGPVQGKAADLYILAKERPKGFYLGETSFR